MAELPSLEFRRMRGDPVEAYKVCNKIYDPLPICDLFEMSTKGMFSGMRNFKKLTVSMN